MNAECKFENLHCTCFYEGNNLKSTTVLLSLNRQYNNLTFMFKKKKKNSLFVLMLSVYNSFQNLVISTS